MTFFGVSKLHLVTVGLCLLMVGCAGGDQYADIKSFMREVEGKELPGIAPLPEFEPYQPFTYGASNRRSPFDAPVIIPQKTDQQRRNVGVKPPQDHVKQYLERFSLASLQMVGYLKRDDGSWALVEDDTGGVHRVQVGDYMGSNWGKIESVSDTGIDVTEIVSDGASGWLRRPRSIELKSVN
ncbi:MAG: type IV pilus assembly protein PilP [Candidatus Azotimanducaceae bacterium]|jgi:type IV pilus assembly protein PilP